MPKEDMQAVEEGVLDRLFRRVYDLLAPIYDRLWSRPDLRGRLVDMLALRSGDRVLETGVGTGMNLPYLAARVGPDGSIDGIDISPRMLERAKRRAADLDTRVDLELGNACSLPYEDGRFDAVLQFGGMNFFSDRRSAVLEMLRVVRPGGRILVADETVAPLGPLRSLLQRPVTALMPRLRPPLHLFPPGSGNLSLSYTPGGLFYMILVEKS
jgi:ubiquinone/menaquinone biosynthesis C-methylase UbiE